MPICTLELLPATILLLLNPMKEDPSYLSGARHWQSRSSLSELVHSTHSAPYAVNLSGLQVWHQPYVLRPGRSLASIVLDSTRGCFEKITRESAFGWSIIYCCPAPPVLFHFRCNFLPPATLMMLWGGPDCRAGHPGSQN